MTSQWTYVAAAYGLTALLGAGVLWHSWRTMRAAERAADALRDGEP
ncbi:MAG: hypothetical protein RLZZ58_1040 [Pseudomonadota bacterium]|jgi:hypothetical protein